MQLMVDLGRQVYLEDVAIKSTSFAPRYLASRWIIAAFLQETSNEMSVNKGQVGVGLAIAAAIAAAVAAALGFRGRAVVIGVDLGTTFSTVAYRTSDGIMHTMRNSWNDTVTASLVALRGDGTFAVGRDAIDAVSDDPMSAVFDAKRLIGRRRDDPVAQAELARHGGRVVPHPRTQRDAFGKVQTGAKLKLCRTCEPEHAFVVRMPNGVSAQTEAAAHKCIDEGSVLDSAAVLKLARNAAAAAAARRAEEAAEVRETESVDGSVAAPAPAGVEDPAAAVAALEAQLVINGRYLLLTPTAAGCIVVSHLLRDLRRELGHGQIKAATVTIPAEFDGSQRTVTLDAYARAGVVPGRVLHEPAAAAIAYGLHRQAAVHHVLVYDMGGGTLDVSVLYAHEGAFTVIGTAGDAHLGGEDFDDCVLGMMAGQLREGSGFVLDGAAADGSDDGAAAAANDANVNSADGSGGSDSSAGSRRRQRKRRDLSAHEHGSCAHSWLKREAERVKIALSGSGPAAEAASWWCLLPSPPTTSAAAVAARGRRTNVTHSVTRADFESTCGPLFDRSLEPVRRGLAAADLSVDEVDEVVLVGGSSRLRRVRALLASMFKRPLRDTVDPDLAVAVGAAMVVD